MFRISSLVVVGAVFLLACQAKAEVSKAEWDAMKKEMAELRKENVEIRKSNDELVGKVGPIKGSVDKMLDTKYGPGAAVVTKVGKLNISGLLQVWYYSIQNDNDGLFNDQQVNDINDSNEGNDNDSFRVRRAEIKFAVDINKYVSAEIMIDPSREAQSYPAFSANTGTGKRSNNTNLANATAGTAGAGRMFQDGFVHFKELVPHHNFKIGQFKPAFGEEGIRSSSQLDFVERSFIGQIGDARDTGVSIHGEWWNSDGKGAGRVQYWLGMFNGAGNYHGSAGGQQNRGDDNDEKDFVFRLLVRPVWKHATFGDLELGGSAQFGTKGESAGADPVDSPVEGGLNRNVTNASRFNAWGSYMPSGPVSGWWFRGEWSRFKDRNAPSAVIDLLGQGNAGAGTVQTNPKTFSAEGWYAATGYKIQDSVFAQDVPRWAKGFEFLFRYDVFENVNVADLITPSQTDVFKTQVFTLGVNYYIKNHNAKIQLNYNIVDNPDGDNSNGTRNFHDVKNDSLVVNFQVAF